MKEEFLSLKYQGVRTPWEILAEPEKFGWQCRKYLKWKAVQTRDGDRAVLAEFADALIDDEKLKSKLLPTINRIFERVQRWRKDKEHFSLEPDQRDGYRDLRRLVSLVSSDPSLIAELLSSRLGLPLSTVESCKDLVELFVGAVIVAYLGEMKVASDAKKTLSGKDSLKMVAEAVRLVEKIYSEYGLKCPKGSKWQVLQAFLKDLEIECSLDPTSPIATQGPKTPISSAVVVETFKGNISALVRTDFRFGILYVSYNVRHPWIVQAMAQKIDLQVFFCAVGQSVLGLLGDKDILDVFLSHLGLSLSRLLKAT